MQRKITAEHTAYVSFLGTTDVPVLLIRVQRGLGSNSDAERERYSNAHRPSPDTAQAAS